MEEKEEKHEWSRGQMKSNSRGRNNIQEPVDAVEKPLSDSKMGDFTKWSVRILLAISSIL